MKCATLLVLACLGHAAPLLAQGLTQSDVLQGTILQGWDDAPGTRMAAVHLRLAPQWKTYWRAPGDAGIPPSFDWSGSENLAGVRFHWPSPEVFHTNGLQTIGYHDELVLPIEVLAADPNRPVVLRARVDLGVCKDICMPAQLDLVADLSLPGAPDASIKAALKARPDTGREAGLGDIACQVEPIKDGLRLTARMELPAQGRSEAVAVESGIAGVWVSEAMVTRDGNSLTAMVDMVPPSGQPFALDRGGVTVTVIGGGGRAVEIRGCPSP